MSRAGKLIFIVLFLLFVLPGLSAIWFYLHPDLLSANRTNHGTLLSAVVTVPALQGQREWQLVYAPGAPCLGPCMHALEALAKLRLAFGRRLYQLQLKVVLPESMPVSMATTLREMDIQAVTFHDVPDTLRQSKVWVVNRQGVVVLMYKDMRDLQALYGDLKHLL